MPLIPDSDEDEDMLACSDCSELVPCDSLTTVASGESVCEDCRDDYARCEACDELHPCGEVETTLYGTDVCGDCLNRHYHWCDHCDGWYYGDDDEHDHDRSCDCVSPQLRFAIRNDGHEPLQNDRRVTVTLPAGIISQVGLSEIAAAVRRGVSWDSPYWRLANDLDCLGSTWQAKDGNYTKRLSRHAYKNHGLKLAPELLSEIGNIGSAHSCAVDFAIEMTRDLNLSAAAFYHDGSCWWSEYGESRCALKSNGGFGVRSFDQYGGVSGRSWVLPLRLTLDRRERFCPTFDTLGADAFVVFNGYGALQGYAAARLLAHMLGLTYRRIGFEASPMYVNSGGYLIAGEEIAKDYTDGRIYLELAQHAHIYQSEQKEVATVA